MSLLRCLAHLKASRQQRWLPVLGRQLCGLLLILCCEQVAHVASHGFTLGEQTTPFDSALMVIRQMQLVEVFLGALRSLNAQHNRLAHGQI